MNEKKDRLKIPVTSISEGDVIHTDILINSFLRFFQHFLKTDGNIHTFLIHQVLLLKTEGNIHIFLVHQVHTLLTHFCISCWQTVHHCTAEETSQSAAVAERLG